MKKILLLALLLSLSMASLHGADFRSIGINAKVCAYTFDGKYYLILSFTDYNDYRLSGHPIIKFLLSDGEIIKLDGYDEYVKYTSNSVYWGFGIVTGNSKENHYVVLPITKEQINHLQKGVDRIAINSIPRVFKTQKWRGKKKFGQELYRDFMELEEDFESADDTTEDFDY